MPFGNLKLASTAGAWFRPGRYGCYRESTSRTGQRKVLVGDPRLGTSQKDVPTATKSIIGSRMDRISYLTPHLESLYGDIIS